MSRFQRMLWKLRFLRSHARSLNRRVEVEQALFDVASGKRAPLTPGECGVLARKLGTLE